MTTSETIIITSDEPFSGSWHTQVIYAEYLSREHLVLFLDPPEKWKPRHLLQKFPPTRKITETLWVIPYHNRFPSILKFFNEWHNARRLLRHLQRVKVSNILLWQFDSFRNALTNITNRRKISLRRIYHVTDPFYRNPLDAELSKAADLIVVSAVNNLSHYDRYAGKKLHVPQMIDVQLARELINAPLDLKVPLSFALVLGTISDALDYDVLRGLAQSGVSLVFAGEKKGLDRHVMNFEALLRFPNVIYVGSLPPHQFFPLIAASNAGVVAYEKSSGEGRAVLKFLHFLVAGKPVITNTRCGDGTLNGHCVYEAQSAGEFAQLCTSAETGRLQFDVKKANDYLETVNIRHAVDRIFEKLSR